MGHYRSYYGLLVISFPKDYSSLEQRCEDRIDGDVKNNLNATISAGSRFQGDKFACVMLRCSYSLSMNAYLYNKNT